MRACANLGVVDSRVVDAVQVRQELDLRIGETVGCTYCSIHTLVGCAFTRFQTRRMTKAFPSVLSDQLISYGPCQFPTLGFVVERVSALALWYRLSVFIVTRNTVCFSQYKQVQAFIPEAFYKIKGLFVLTE